MAEKDNFDLLDSITDDKLRLNSTEIRKATEPLRREIDLIPDKFIREYVSIILYYSDYFWDSPASNLEDHYPLDEYGKGGLVLHTKRTVRAMFCIINSAKVSEEDVSALMAAAILHGVCKPLTPYDPDSDEGNLHDINFMINIDRFIMEAFQKAIADMVYPNISNELELKYQIILNKIMRLIHCCEGTFSPIEELFPEDTLEIMFASAQIVAKSLHVIVDGFDIIDERWQFESQPEDQEA